MTGMTHSVSELSYLISRDSTFSEVFELLLSLQGVWIFILFVLKRRVFILIKQRLVRILKISIYEHYFNTDIDIESFLFVKDGSV